jgi:hypothetical protein
MRMLKSWTWILGVVLVLAVALLAIAQAADEPKAPAAKVHEYAGTKACKICHTGPSKGAIYETWEKTGHATAFAKLPEANKKDPKCLACHTTGFGKPGGYDPAVVTTASLEGVGCEACHGPGKDYKGSAIMKDPVQAKANGLIAPDAATCKACHEGVTPEGHKALPKFDLAAMKAKIEHHLPKK